MPAQKAKRDLYLDVTRTRIVPGGHRSAKFLVARAGTDVPERLANTHGVTDGDVPTPDDGAATPDLSAPRVNVLPEAEPPRRGPGRPAKNP